MREFLVGGGRRSLGQQFVPQSVSGVRVQSRQRSTHSYHRRALGGSTNRDRSGGWHALGRGSDQREGYSATSGAYIGSLPLLSNRGVDSSLHRSSSSLDQRCGFPRETPRMGSRQTTRHSILGNLGAKAFGFRGSVELATDGNEVWVTDPRADSVTEIASSTRKPIAILKARRFAFSSPDAIPVLRHHVWGGSGTQSARGPVGGYVTEWSK